MKKESKILLIASIAIVVAVGAAFEWNLRPKQASIGPESKEQTDPKEAYGDAWWLRLAPGNQADRSFVSDDPQHVRVKINHIESKESYDIQLNLMHLKVKSSKRYAVEFRAKADQPRSLVMGFAKAHDPWTNLGLYSEIQLKPEWQTFHSEFIATADDDNGRIHFDLAGNTAPVEVSQVTLRSLPDRKIIQPSK
jgi:hypothetical protein